MDATLKRLQETELEILLYVDSFCRENGIPYSLSGGTLLGAVRHHGFIPWDDDVDIMMMREDYDRFAALWRQKADTDKYLLQTKETEPAFTQSFMKIRKRNTTFLQQGEVPGRYHNGIFIDIMPADRFPAGRIARRFYYLDVMFYQLFTREFAPVKNGRILRLGSQVILALVPKKLYPRCRAFFYKRLTKQNTNKSLQIISTETASSMRRHYSPDLMDAFMNIEFEGHMLRCTTKWEEVLVTGYGDYHKLPPEEERAWRHRPKRIEFERK